MLPSQLSEALERFQGPLLRYATRLLKDEEKAREVVQETFLKLWKATDVDSLSPWLHQVCRNLAFDVMRKDRRMVIVDSVPETAAPPPDAALSEVLAAVAALPARDQEVVRLKFQSGLSYKDIARVTGLSESNIGVIIHNSIKKLRSAVARTEAAQ